MRWKLVLWLWTSLVILISCDWTDQVKIVEVEHVPDRLNEEYYEFVGDETIDISTRRDYLDSYITSDVSTQIPHTTQGSGESSPEEPLTTTETSTTDAIASSEDPDLPNVTSEQPGVITPENEISRSSEENTEDIEEPVIKTTSGSVKGFKWRNNSDVIAYIDIPYGNIKSPFERPSAFRSDSDIHEEVEHTRRCPQLKNGTYLGGLDCLTLSIFVPAVAENASVFFYIHEPYIGSADPNVYSPEYLVSKGIILIMPNYRFGVPGFLCLLNETAPGNAGLKDLALALEWVNNNIEKFGGNVLNVVVSGDGTAGALVGYLTLYSPTRYYINRAITESGSALSPNALDRNPLYAAERIANKIREEMGYGTLNNTFAEATLADIVTAANEVTLNPCIELDSNEETFMNSTPWQNLKNELFNITFMIGSASYAGTHEALLISQAFIDSLNTDLDLIFPSDLYFDSSVERAKLGQTTRSQYFGEGNVTATDHLEELSLYFTDALYLGPAIRLARSLSDSGAKIFVYEFDFVGALNKEFVTRPRPIQGAIRNDVVRYIFKQHEITINDNSPEQQMIDLMVNLWANFIIHGEPTTPRINWTEFKNATESEEEWLRITSEPKMSRGIHVDRLNLWTTLYNEHYIDRSFSITLTPSDYAMHAAFTILIMSYL